MGDATPMKLQWSKTRKLISVIHVPRQLIVLGGGAMVLSAQTGTKFIAAKFR